MSLAIIVSGCSGLISMESPAPVTNVGVPTTTTTSTTIAGPSSSTSSTTTTSTTTTTIAGDPVAIVSPSGVVVPILSASPSGGWVVGTPCANTATLDSGMPVTHVQVLIDPGHGGDETGAVASSGLRESDLNLDVAERLQRFLEYRGVSTLLTRTDDYRVAIAARGELALRVEPDVFISIHHNGGPTTATREPGTLVFHQVASDDSRRLAGLVYEELVDTLSGLDVSYAAGSPPGAVAMLNDAGLDYYGVLRRTEGVTSVLSESFFLTNPAEAAILESGYVREQEAIALGKAILRFLDTEEVGTGFLDPRTFEGPGSGTGGTAGCSDPDLL